MFHFIVYMCLYISVIHHWYSSKASATYKEDGRSIKLRFIVISDIDGVLSSDNLCLGGLCAEDFTFAEVVMMNDTRN